MVSSPALDLNLVRTLLVIVEEGSFTRAAQRIGRTQSAISLRIQRLENALGQRLLSRSRGGAVFLTQEGAAFVERSRALLDMSDEVMLGDFDKSSDGKSPEEHRVDVRAKLFDRLNAPSPISLGTFESGRPSVVVLPFRNLSRHPEEQYLSDGVADWISTELGRYRTLMVISGEQFVSQALESRSAVLGEISYIVDGSVRRQGRRLRIAVRLAESQQGRQVWAERYDGDQDDLFAIQDVVVATLVATLVGRLQAAGAEHAKRKHPNSLAAYECVVRGHALPVGDRGAAKEARALFIKATELDPQYARAYGLLAHSYLTEWHHDMSGSRDALLIAHQLAQKAVALDEDDAHCHEALAMTHHMLGSFDLAEIHCLRAVELNENNPALRAALGQLYVYSDRVSEALDCFRQARHLDPFFEPSWYWPYVGIAHFVSRRYDDAVVALTRSSNRPYWAFAYLVASQALNGRCDLGEEAKADLFKRLPAFSTDCFATHEAYKLPSDREHLIAGLRCAGLP